MMNRNLNKHHRMRAQRGAALLTVLLLTAVLGLLLPVFVNRTSFHYAVAIHETRWLTASHIAQRAIDDALWHLNHAAEELGIAPSAVWQDWETDDVTNPTYFFLPTTVADDGNGNPLGEYNVMITDLDQTNPQIVVNTGVPDLETQGNQVRRFRVLLNTTNITGFASGFFSDKDFDLGGTTVVDSYDSSLGPYGGTNVGNQGNIGSNQNIRVFGNALIDGNAGAGGNVTSTGGGEITGDVQGGLSQVLMPDFSDLVIQAMTVNNNANIPLAVRSNGQTQDAYNSSNKTLSLNAGATLVLSGGPSPEEPKVYFFHEITLNGGSILEIDGYVQIMTDGDLSLNGGNVTNLAGSGDPHQLLIYSSGGPDTTIKINGGAGFAGGIFAPTANIHFSGGGNIYGSAVGGAITVIGNAEFHYDESFGGTEAAGPAIFDLVFWQEIRPPKAQGV